MVVVAVVVVMGFCCVFCGTPRSQLVFFIVCVRVRALCFCFGCQQGEEVITAEDVGARIGTINYEVLTSALARVRRQFAPML